jgi:hypothetical protein
MGKKISDKQKFRECCKQDWNRVAKIAYTKIPSGTALSAKLLNPAKNKWERVAFGTHTHTKSDFKILRYSQRVISPGFEVRGGGGGLVEIWSKELCK